jgi:hypothetical protein
VRLGTRKSSFFYSVDMIVRVAGCDYSHSFDKLFTLHSRWKKKMVYRKPHHDVASEYSLESIPRNPRNRFLGSLNVYKFGLRQQLFFHHRGIKRPMRGEPNDNKISSIKAACVSAVLKLEWRSACWAKKFIFLCNSGVHHSVCT